MHHYWYQSIHLALPSHLIDDWSAWLVTDRVAVLLGDCVIGV